MALMPVRTKFRKMQKGQMAGLLGHHIFEDRDEASGQQLGMRDQAKQAEREEHIEELAVAHPDIAPLRTAAALTAKALHFDAVAAHQPFDQVGAPAFLIGLQG